MNRDQLYFDRIHAAVPILHQRRYLSWSKSPVKTSSRTCLQYAMWATASLMSAQFQHLQDNLYSDVKRMLASASLPNYSGQSSLTVDVELVQAWVLAATFEFVKTNHHEACISASRALRLAQLMGLYKIDISNNSPASSESDFIITEERRRVFWMAFILESLYSMRNNLPLVINEYNVSLVRNSTLSCHCSWNNTTDQRYQLIDYHISTCTRSRVPEWATGADWLFERLHRQAKSGCEVTTQRVHHAYRNVREDLIPCAPIQHALFVQPDRMRSP